MSTIPFLAALSGSFAHTLLSLLSFLCIHTITTFPISTLISSLVLYFPPHDIPDFHIFHKSNMTLLFLGSATQILGDVLPSAPLLSFLVSPLNSSSTLAALLVTWSCILPVRGLPYACLDHTVGTALASAPHDLSMSACICSLPSGSGLL